MSELVNFYSLLPKCKKNDTAKGYKNHYIDKNSRILMIGSSGTGKSNSILNFIEKLFVNKIVKRFSSFK
jgi:ABC-type lipoprotein export system ATPase subunit